MEGEAKGHKGQVAGNTGGAVQLPTHGADPTRALDNAFQATPSL